MKNPKKLTASPILMILLAVLLIVGGAVYMARKKSGASFQLSNPRNGNEDISEPGKTKSGRDLRAVSKRAHQLLNPVPERLKVSQFEDYLRQENRSARSLVAVYLLTDDSGIINELKNHTDDPDALLCLMESPKTPMEKKWEYSKLYSQLKPGEMQGYMAMACMSSSLKHDKEEVMDLIHKGMKSENLTLGFNSTDGVRSALQTAGYDRLDAEIYLDGNYYQPASIMHQSVSMLEYGCKASLEGVSDPNDKINIVNSYLSVSDSIKELVPYTNWGSETEYFSLVWKLLSNLPPDAQLGEGRGSVGESLERLYAERAAFSQTEDKVSSLLRTASPEVVDQYLEKRIEIGQSGAGKWLIEQKNK